ncbi:transcription factor S [Euryarchaeota archaeon ex4484_162]|nr:MAG: transcription factor S [Euryarchaeota archaeon ex4484_162]RLF62256.1 MAG: transcription factor S [Thermoplasmata archaeon]
MMKFCPKCKSLMYPKGDSFVCKKCGYEEKKSGKRVIETKRKEKKLAIIEEKIEVLPKARVTCPKCGNKEAYWMLKQTRSSDEPETTFYICTKCGYKWREY